MRAAVLAALLATCLLLEARPARADERFVDQGEPTHSYAGEIVGVTLAAQSFFWLGVAAESGWLGAIGGLTQVLGPAIVHWGHGNGWQGGLSLGIHLTVPVISVFVVTMVALSVEDGPGCGGCSDTASAGLVGGLLIGVATAATLDCLLLAWDAGGGEPEQSLRAGGFRVWVAPSLAPGTVGLSAGAQI